MLEGSKGIYRGIIISWETGREGEWICESKVSSSPNSFSLSQPHPHQHANLIGVQAQGATPDSDYSFAGAAFQPKDFDARVNNINTRNGMRGSHQH